MDRLDWRTVELLGQAFYAERGHRVLISQVEAPIYDFVIEGPQGFRSVNVKCATKDNRKTSYYISRHRADRPTPDLYLVWFHEHHLFIEICGSILLNKRTATIPKASILEALDESRGWE